jgi:hypothetical protein
VSEYEMAIENLIDAVSSDWISIILAILVVIMGIVVFIYVVMTIVDMFLSKDIVWGIEIGSKHSSVSSSSYSLSQ